MLYTGMRIDISIHALREEGDLALQGGDLIIGQISIHALREEGDLRAIVQALPPLTFLSTPSARRATGRSVSSKVRTIISIHALREEGD